MPDSYFSSEDSARDPVFSIQSSETRLSFYLHFTIFSLSYEIPEKYRPILYVFKLMSLLKVVRKEDSRQMP
ncbi:hypothetical protein GCM10007176_21360 [Salinicoccus roseus]|nr:hypothetical protein GCM10007176_21360 [Salinicoccus roseus]